MATYLSPILNSAYVGSGNTYSGFRNESWYNTPKIAVPGVFSGVGGTTYNITSFDYSSFSWEEQYRQSRSGTEWSVKNVTDTSGTYKYQKPAAWGSKVNTNPIEYYDYTSYSVDLKEEFSLSSTQQAYADYFGGYARDTWIRTGNIGEFEPNLLRGQEVRQAGQFAELWATGTAKNYIENDLVSILNNAPIQYGKVAGESIWDSFYNLGGNINLGNGKLNIISNSTTDQYDYYVGTKTRATVDLKPLLMGENIDINAMIAQSYLEKYTGRKEDDTISSVTDYLTNSALQFMDTNNELYKSLNDNGKAIYTALYAKAAEELGFTSTYGDVLRRMSEVGYYREDSTSRWGNTKRGKTVGDKLWEFTAALSGALNTAKKSVEDYVVSYLKTSMVMAGEQYNLNVQQYAQKQLGQSLSYYERATEEMNTATASLNTEIGNVNTQIDQINQDIARYQAEYDEATKQIEELERLGSYSGSTWRAGVGTKERRGSSISSLLTGTYGVTGTPNLGKSTLGA